MSHLTIKGIHKVSFKVALHNSSSSNPIDNKYFISQTCVQYIETECFTSHQYTGIYSYKTDLVT